jgi:hypothetical protein
VSSNQHTYTYARFRPASIRTRMPEASPA